MASPDTSPSKKSFESEADGYRKLWFSYHDAMNKINYWFGNFGILWGIRAAALYSSVVGLWQMLFPEYWLCMFGAFETVYAADGVDWQMVYDADPTAAEFPIRLLQITAANYIWVAFFCIALGTMDDHCYRPTMGNINLALFCSYIYMFISTLSQKWVYQEAGMYSGAEAAKAVISGCLATVAAFSLQYEDLRGPTHCHFFKFFKKYRLAAASIVYNFLGNAIMFLWGRLRKNA